MNSHTDSQANSQNNQRMTITQACQHFGRSVSTLRRWIKDGEVDAEKNNSNSSAKPSNSSPKPSARWNANSSSTTRNAPPSPNSTRTRSPRRTPNSTRSENCPRRSNTSTCMRSAESNTRANCSLHTGTRRKMTKPSSHNRRGPRAPAPTTKETQWIT